MFLPNFSQECIMTEPHLNSSRPLVILIICFVGFINTAQLFYMAFSPVPKQLGVFYPYYFTISSLVSLISIGGLWYLKKWSVWLYCTVLIANQLVLTTMGLWEFSAVIIPVIIIILLIKNLHKMS